MNNIELIQDLYRAFSEGDIERVGEILDPEIVWQQMPHFPDGGRWIGIEQVAQKVFGHFAERWSGFGAHAEHFIDGGDRIVVLGAYEGVFNDTGKSVHSPFAHVYTIEDRKVTRFEQYADTHAVHLARMPS